MSSGPATEDGGWITLCGPASTRPLQAALQAVDPHLDVEVAGTPTDWTATVVRRDEPGAAGRRGRGHPVQHRRDVRVRAAAVPADHAGLSAGTLPRMPARNGDHGYGYVSKALHWITFSLILGQFLVGYTMSTEDPAAERAADRVHDAKDRCEATADSDAAEAEEERCEEALERRGGRARRAGRRRRRDRRCTSGSGWRSC